jgi:hypothetical protein
MRLRKTVLVAATVAALADAEAQLLPGASRQDSALARVLQYGSSFGVSQRSLAARLGKPLKVDSRVEANRAGYGKDTIFSVRYAGITFHVRQSGYDHKTQVLEAVEQTSPRSPSPTPLKIGTSSRRDIERIVGTTRDSSRQADTLFLTHQSPLTGADEWVIFALVGDVLRAIRWVLYTG